MFFPPNSLLTSNVTVVVCHSTGANPMWMHSDDTIVTGNASLPVHQMPTENNTELVVSDLTMFMNGVYRCLGNGNMASLGLFIKTPGIMSHTMCVL